MRENPKIFCYVLGNATHGWTALAHLRAIMAGCYASASFAAKNKVFFIKFC
jgi:hypothetical protein